MGKQRISNIFSTNKMRLSLYLTAGYPRLDSMVSLVEIMDKSGVDFVELGMPYSDPLADGATIQKSSSIALMNGLTLDIYFDQVMEARKVTTMPLLFMGYFNQMMRYGIEKFLLRCVEVGIDGLIIPDLPPDIYESQYQGIFENYDLAMIFLVTPTCSDIRIKKIDELSTGFVYVVSSSSTTGKTVGFGQEQLDYFKRIENLKLDNPTVIGFGISNYEAYSQANNHANGAIIGSAYIKSIAKGDAVISTEEFINKIRIQR